MRATRPSKLSSTIATKIAMRRDLEAGIHRLDDRVEAAEQRRGGERVRQQVDAPRAPRR